MEEDHAPIQFVRCQRCNLSLRVRVRKGNPDALLMRYAQSGQGLCASCAATAFLHSVEHIKAMVDAKREMLLWEPMQTQFAALMREGHADASPQEIDWQHVHDHWDLPFPVAGGAAPGGAVQQELFFEDEEGEV
jgi:hypothetical protein